MSGDDVREFFEDVGLVLLWSAIAMVLVLAVFEYLNKRYDIMREVFEENSIAAAVLAGSFVLGVFYTVTHIVVS